MLPPLTGPLLDEPGFDRRPVVAAVPAELEARHPPSARLGADPGLGHAEPLRDLGGGEEPLAFVLGHQDVFQFSPSARRVYVWTRPDPRISNSNDSPGATRACVMFMRTRGSGRRLENG